MVRCTRYNVQSVLVCQIHTRSFTPNGKATETQFQSRWRRGSCDVWPMPVGISLATILLWHPCYHVFKETGFVVLLSNTYRGRNDSFLYAVSSSNHLLVFVFFRFLKLKGCYILIIQISANMWIYQQFLKYILITINIIW